MSKSQEPQPTPATKIITLLEQQKIQQGDPNGTYSINLKHEVTLNDGDSINLTKGFIDTSAQDSNFIKVEPDETTITVKHGMYWTDTQSTPGSIPAWGKFSVPDGERPEGYTYILQNQSEVGANTFFDWNTTNNPFAGGGTNFNVELKPVTTGEPQFGIMDYNLIGSPDLGIPATLPPGEGQVLQQKYILDGTLNLSTDNGTIDFLFYPLGYVVPAEGIGANDHTAVFTRWIEGTTIKGWKAKANPNVTSPSPNPPFAHWYFLSDTNGYNYFGDGGNAHLVQLQSIKIPLNSTWLSGDTGSVNLYPEVALQYKDTNGNTQRATKLFDMYPPVTIASKRDLNAGIQQLITEIGTFANKPTDPSYAPKIPPKDVAEEFRGKNWGKEWDWYQFEQWVDPLELTGNLLFPAVQFSVDELPILAYANYDGNKPYDQAFVNGASQFGVTENGKRIGNRLQPWQLPDLKPVINPDSAGSEMLPREYTTTITIASGNYTYDDLAQLLTDKLNAITSPITGLSNNPSSTSQPLNAAGFSSSYLLQTSYELSMQYDGYNPVDPAFPDNGYPTYPNDYVFSAVDIPERLNPTRPAITAKNATDEGVQPYWVSEDGTRLFSFDATGLFPNPTATFGPQVVGAENFSIVFDDTSQRFQLLQAHTPIYIDGPILSATGQPVVKGPGSTVIRQVIGPTSDSSLIGELKTIDTSSGVFLTDLQPRSLWFNKMGFNSSMLTHIGPHDSAIQNFSGGQFSDASLLDCKVHPLSLETGRNKTGYFSGVDNLITKNADFYQLEGTTTTAIWNEDIAVNIPVGLRGSAIIESSDDQPFYNIEISGVNGQDFSGQVYENSLIQGCIGKYFSQGNFTESNGDGFLYTHKGTPLTIQSLRVRILDTQMNLEPGLGPNSALILEINTVK